MCLVVGEFYVDCMGYLYLFILLGKRFLDVFRDELDR